MTDRLKNEYFNNVTRKLNENFSYKNVMQIPKISKIIINMGVGEAVKDNKKLEAALTELTAISGQKPVVTKAKKANASFKLRQGMAVGLKVTLKMPTQHPRWIFQLPQDQHL